MCITAIQETMYRDKNAFESEGYRIFKGKIGSIETNNAAYLETSFAVSCRILNSVIDLQSFISRISLLCISYTNKTYTIVNAHALIKKKKG